jgi:hypothetical protein
VIIKEDADPRRRAPGEMTRILRQGILAAGMSDENVRCITVEADAVRAALTDLTAGDLVIVMAEDVRGVLDVIRSTDTSVSAVQS